MKMPVLVALAATFVLSCAAAAITYDGANIPTDFTGSLKATQNNPTTWGDTSGVNTGSELDQLFVARDWNGLFIAVTGNLESKNTGTANAYVILLETGPGGSRVLTPKLNDPGVPGAVANLNGMKLDYGFAPNWAITFNNWDNTVYVDAVDLVNNIGYYLGSQSVNSGGCVLGTSHNSQLAYNNTNIAGVTDNASKTPAENQTDAAGAATGAEMWLTYDDIGITEPWNFNSVKVMVILDSASGYLSNQTLPGLGGGYGNLGQGGSGIDFSAIPGDQFTTVDVSEPTPNLIILDGAGVPTDFDGYLVATQDNHTGFGDRSGSEGSELDQLFIGQDPGGLEIGITGNLETGGNFWLTFLEAGPGGCHVLQVPDGVGPASGVLALMRGTTFNAGFAPTHVLCFNTFGGTCWVDLVDLRTGTGRYLGHGAINGASGDLSEGDNPNNALLAFNNTNRLGVTSADASGASTATTGAEIYLPFADLGVAACSVKAMVLLTSNQGFVSSQALGPFGLNTPDFGGPPVDFSGWGQQFVAVPLSGFTFVPTASVQAARALPDGSPVLMQNVRVSASFPGQGVFYVQDSAPRPGIPVYDSATSPAEGALVDVRGFVTYAFGERAVGACQTTIVQQPGSVHTRPLGMSDAALGGGGAGYNPGVTGAVGAPNLGTLAKIWGRVTTVDSGQGFFYVDGGSRLEDGTTHDDGSGNQVPNVGVRVSSSASVDLDDFVEVVGISSVFTTYDSANAPVRHRLVRPRAPGDVTGP